MSFSLSVTSEHIELCTHSMSQNFVIISTTTKKKQPPNEDRVRGSGDIETITDEIEHFFNKIFDFLSNNNTEKGQLYINRREKWENWINLIYYDFFFSLARDRSKYNEKPNKRNIRKLMFNTNNGLNSKMGNLKLDLPR